jgi:Flp pilus assembly protein TadD
MIFSRSPLASSRRWRWVLFGVVALLLAAGAAETWRRWHGPAHPIPPLPDIVDAEVRQAVQRARQKVLDQPGDAKAWGRLGMIFLVHHLYSEADSCFREAARLDPHSPNWPYGRALAALKWRPDDVPVFLRQALVAADQSAPEYQSAVRLQLAEACLERQEWEEAEKLFQEERRLRPDDPRVALGLGLIALARDDRRSAEDYLRQAQASPLARKKATVQLAVLARLGGDVAAAAKYDRETEALPDDPPWPDLFREEIEQLRVGHHEWLRQESLLENQHRFAEAAALYLQEAQTNPTARGLARAGFNLARAGDNEQAEKYLREAVRLDRNSAHAHYLYAYALFVWGETEWKRAADSPQARQWLQACIEEAQRTTQLQPTQARAYMFWGLSQKYLGEPAAAIAPLRQGVECAPEDFHLQLALGEVLLDVGKYPEAQTHLKNAQKQNPNDPRPAQALEHLRRAAAGRGASGRSSPAEREQETNNKITNN